MPQINLSGQLFELNNRDLLTLLGRIADTQHTLAHNIARSHQEGFPDVTGELWKASAKQEWQQLQENILQISDLQLRNHFESMATQIAKMFEIDDSLVALIATFLGMQKPKTKEDHAKLSRKVNSLKGPTWIRDSTFQSLAERSQKILTTVQDLQLQIQDRIDQLKVQVDLEE